MDRKLTWLSLAQISNVANQEIDDCCLKLLESLKLNVLLKSELSCCSEKLMLMWVKHLLQGLAYSKQKGRGSFVSVTVASQLFWLVAFSA
jgi:hypothetical protein